MTDETEPPRPPSAPPRELSYSEKFAGTPYGRPAVEPVIVPASPEPRARSRFGCFGIVLIVIGLYWLIPGVLGFVSTLNLWYSGKLFDRPLPPSLERAIGTVLVISMVVSIVYILIGLKILVRPGRYSVGCTGVLAFLGAVFVALQVAGIKDPPTSVLIVLGVYLALTVVFTLAALSAAQILD